MPRRRRLAYESTSVTISRSREEIDGILRKWGVNGVQWEDDFGEGIVNLRFRWKRDGNELVARFRLQLDNEEDLREKAIDGRNGKFSQTKYERVLAERGKREHRLLAAFLKDSFEAIEQGIISAEALLLPWIEDSRGKTVIEHVQPVMHKLGGNTLHKALESGE